MQHMVFLLPRPCPIGCRPTTVVAPPEQATTGLQPSPAGSRRPFLKSPSFPSSSLLSLSSL
uniref:Uncharacterized protein n=1 Tax=Triticum urartu TaxID=4572 RepID=A0A8R7UUA4_TRIUA